MVTFCSGKVTQLSRLVNKNLALTRLNFKFALSKLSQKMKKLITVVLMLLPIMALAQNRPQDWAQFGRYAESNSALTEKPIAVLYGDSNLAGRGISGQTTSQILVRMQQDVVSLAPKYVVILCGINDIAKNAGYAPDLKSMLGSIRSMCQIAKANKIRPILCTLLPSYKLSWRLEIENPLPDVQEFNSMLKEYAREAGIKVIDYYEAFADADGKMPAVYSADTVHPNAEGYAVMEGLVLKALGIRK